MFSIFLRGDADAIERISYEFCEDLANSGVLYCEARYCPHLLANCGVDDIPCSEKHNVSPEKVVETVNRGLEKGCQDFEIKVCTILTCMRHRPGEMVSCHCYTNNVYCKLTSYCSDEVLSIGNESSANTCFPYYGVLKIIVLLLT